MAGDKEFAIKVSIDPFQEVDKKNFALMAKKEIGLKYPKKIDFSDKFSVTSVKWNKKTLEVGVRAIFRYDLSLLASQVWERYTYIEKAKNGQDKMKKTNEFIKIVPKLIKNCEKVLTQKFAEMKEDVASGASDDLGQIKGTRKSLTAGHPMAMADLAETFLDEFEKKFKDMAKLKKKEMKSSGEEKEKAKEELDELLKSGMPELVKKLSSALAVLRKRLGVLASVPAAMKKSMNKDMSDAAKTEYKKSMDTLGKAVTTLESQISKFGKNVAAALEKIKRRDISNGTYNLIVEAVGNLSGAAAKLEDVMSKIDTNLKKLEQTAKKR